MQKESNIYLDLKYGNRNRVFNKIREAGSISSSALSYELQLSRPTIKQNVDELMGMGLIYESGTFGHTGGRRAKAYSIVKKNKVAVGIDLTKNHVTTIVIDLSGDLIYEKRVRLAFSQEDNYKRELGRLVEEAIKAQDIENDAVMGVGIAVPGLITEDQQKVFYGEILKFTGMAAEELGKYIPYPCRLYNDADAGGYAEISQSEELTDAFYISLSNNIGGSILIDHKVYKGESPRSGEIGHMTVLPGGGECYCGQQGCFEVYCNATILSGQYEGDLAMFFQQLDEGEERCRAIWKEYLHYLSIAVNNIRMLFDCKVILGGYVGAHLEKYMDELKRLAMERNTFEDNADYLRVCKVKKDALALGSALPFIHEFWKTL